MKTPRDCTTRDEVREEIDRLDRGLVDLLAERWSYVDRMWELKRAEASEANVPWRNRAVIEKVKARAAEKGLPPEMAEALWRQIIGWGIQYQEERLRDS
ncbi:MAG: chorismate mutase [Alphaproteobacteria bacterium RIFCSPHIGHO2_12_FULL_63_12]|nr:MAG: chorismate mutase [Alphaproteobacteria bacterium RIFCSPHIGHO2_12_FULL_63_12]